MTLLLNVILLLYTAWILWSLRGQSPTRYASLIIKISWLLVITVVVAVLMAEDIFELIQCMTWAVFVYTPIILLSTTAGLRGQAQHFKLVTMSLAILIIGVGVDAFIIEPHWLQATHYTLTNAKLDRPLRIVLIADIQTDQPGTYEARIFQRVKTEHPDLILFAGDYIQLQGQAYEPAVQTLNRLLRRADFQPSLGMVAVQGNVDHADWARIFAHLPVKIVKQSEDLDLGPLTITALSLEDSFLLSQPIAARESYHLVLGHCPNFALGQIDADLLLAGHTHGGQVRLPFIGPLLTFSRVPRQWAGGGLHQIEPEKYLCISRGLGMERHHAPRLRFLCRPELVIFDLKPAG